MKIDRNKASSRFLGVARALVGNGIDEKAVFSKHVVLMGEPDVLSSANGQWCFMDAVRLLMRISGHLTAIIPSGFDDLEQRARECCAENFLGRMPQLIIGDTHEDFTAADAILNVGNQVNPNLPWTSINSNRWVARVSSGSCALNADINQPNPIAALMAASLGVAEVFKRIVGISAAYAPLIDMDEFSLFDLANEKESCGPELPININIPDTLLVGAGAIGNGIALLMSQLPLGGRLHIVDSQDYQDENLGTSVLVDPTGWLGIPKAKKLAGWLSLNSKLTVTGEKDFIENALSQDVVKSMKVDLVLNGLDDVQARYDSQLAWPRIIVDGGINETGAAVVQHRLDNRGMACLHCSFELPKEDHIKTQQRLTGLSLASLADQGRVLAEEDIDQADSHKREWLKKMYKQKRRICSVVSEAALESFGVNAVEGFRPSVPFVATAAAALVVAQAVKALQFPHEPYPQWFTIGSILLGSESAVQVNRFASPSCLCVRKRGMINSIRQKRNAILE